MLILKSEQVKIRQREEQYHLIIISVKLFKKDNKKKQKKNYYNKKPCLYYYLKKIMQKIQKLEKQIKKQKKTYKKKIELLTGESMIPSSENLPAQEKNQKRSSKIESARQTRMRKKIYIELLEKKLKKREQELKQLTNEFEKLKDQKFNKNNAMYENLKVRTELFKKIQQSVRNQDQYQTNNYLDILRLRYGISGEERAVMLDTTLKQFIQFLMPMHFRYLMQFCNEKKQFYELFSENEEYKLHMNFNFLDYAQKKELAKIRPLLFQHKQIYNTIVQKIVDLKKVVLKQNDISQKIIDNLRKAFKPCFVAQFLLKLDQKRNVDDKMKQLYPINYWEISKKQKLEEQQKKISNEIYNFEFQSKDSREMQLFSINQQEELDYLL